MDYHKRMTRSWNFLMWIGHNKWGITNGQVSIVRPSTTSKFMMEASIDKFRHPTNAEKVEHLEAQSQTVFTVSSQLKNSKVIFILLLILLTVLSSMGFRLAQENSKRRVSKFWFKSQSHREIKKDKVFLHKCDLVMSFDVRH